MEKIVIIFPSDVLGFIEKTDDVIYLDNEDFVIINQNGLNISKFDGSKAEYQITKVSKEFADVYKGDYAHFTLKEISEQPATIIKAGNDKRIEDAERFNFEGKKSIHNW